MPLRNLPLVQAEVLVVGVPRPHGEHHTTRGI